MIVYNIPLAGLMGYDTILKLAKIDNVKGIKYTASSHYEITKLKADLGEDFMIYSGSDEMAISGLLAGADGLIGSTYNVLSDTFLSLYDFYVKGDIAKANDVMKEVVEVILKMLSYGNLNALLKTLNRMRGVDAGYARSPFRNFTKEEEVKIAADLRELKKTLNLQYVGFIEELN